MRWSALLLSVLLLAPGLAQAGSLFDELGGREKISAFTADLVARIGKDPRVAHFFVETDMGRLRDRLTDLICHVTGERRHYRGANLRAAHAGLGIHQADFNAVVEDLEAAMDDSAIPFATQERLLAKLAPLEREIVDIPDYRLLPQSPAK